MQRRSIVEVSFLSLVFAVAARAEEKIAIHGFLDIYYGWNANQPGNHRNFVPGTGTTAVKANELAINLAEVEFVRDPKPVGFKFSMVAGDGTDVVHASDPARDTFRYIYQASLSYKVSSRVLLEAGVFSSHIGYEGFYSKDNWNYSRGWMGEFSPYYQAGVKASYVWNDRWSGQLHILNGWQIIGENNDAKSVGTQIAYSAPRFGVTFNTLVGPELPNDNKHLRLFGDWIATYQATKQLSFAASLDRGRQSLPNDAAANWLGASIWGRYGIDDRHAFAARVERFRDPDNGISGTPQTLTGGTVTYELRPDKNLIVKIEGRRDHSDAPVFSKSQGSKTNNETLVVVGVVATF